MEGVLHRYLERPPLNLFEYTPGASHTFVPALQTPPNVIVFIGGLNDNFSSPPYLKNVARLFPRHAQQQWTLMHIQLSSAMKGYGTSHINQDIREIALAVTFIRDIIRKGLPTNVVLLGQSTGCQDALHYISAPIAENLLRPQVQGVILQAPLSDREYLMTSKVNQDAECKAAFDSCLELLSTVPEKEHTTFLLPLVWTMPLFGKAPLCASRFLDLASPSSPMKPRKEDLFSHDLHQTALEETFGQVGKRNILTKSREGRPSLLILISESDERFSEPLTAQSLLQRWERALASNSDNPVELYKNSHCIKDATHNLSGDTVAQKKAMLISFLGALLEYIKDVVGSVDNFAFEIYKEGEEWIRSLEQDH